MEEDLTEETEEKVNGTKQSFEQLIGERVFQDHSWEQHVSK